MARFGVSTWDMDLMVSTRDMARFRVSTMEMSRFKG